MKKIKLMYEHHWGMHGAGFRPGRGRITKEGYDWHQKNTPGKIKNPVAPSMSTYYIISEKCHGCGHCKKVCQFGAISGSKKQVHTIDSTKCVHCGNCIEKCKHEAISVIT